MANETGAGGAGGAGGASNVSTVTNAPQAGTNPAAKTTGTEENPHRDTPTGGTTNPQGGVTTRGEVVTNAAGDRPRGKTGDTPAEKVEKKPAEKVDTIARELAQGDTERDNPQFREPEGTVHHDQFRTSFKEEQAAKKTPHIS